MQSVCIAGFIYFAVRMHKDGRKQHTCKYCHKTVVKVPLHLEDCHSEVSEVVHALAYPSKSKEHRTAFAKIRREGDYQPSVKMLKTKDKALAVCRGKKDIELSLCPNCCGIFSTKFLYRHMKHCLATFLVLIAVPGSTATS